MERLSEITGTNQIGSFFNGVKPHPDLLRHTKATSAFFLPYVPARCIDQRTMATAGAPRSGRRLLVGEGGSIGLSPYNGKEVAVKRNPHPPIRQSHFWLKTWLELKTLRPNPNRAASDKSRVPLFRLIGCILRRQFKI